VKTENRSALKEWAVVCRALEMGRQTLIVRKGGIQEEEGEFRTAHHEFWLLPTYEHQRRDALAQEAADLFDAAASPHGPRGEGPGAQAPLRISLYATVEEETHLIDRASIPGLAGAQILSERTLQDRFDYRTPGLIVLMLRAYRLEDPYELPVRPELAGCRSWVDLGHPLSTQGVRPVLDDASFQAQVRRLRRLLEPVRYA
jgi:hypothetical protein